MASYYERNREALKAKAKARYQEKRKDIRAQQATYRARMGKEWVRAQNLKNKFGLDLVRFETMLDVQGGGCAICGSDDPGGRGSFHVDHDHHTGAIRGLLCHGCNTGLGGLKDSVEILEKAAAYLRRSKE